MLFQIGVEEGRKGNMREGISLALNFKQSGHRYSTIQGCRPQTIVFISVPATYHYLSILLQSKEKPWLYMTFSNRMKQNFNKIEGRAEKKLHSN
jgi:hypothetical protein